jgi:membrane-associated phospholipid phosphatase
MPSKGNAAPKSNMNMLAAT